MNLCMLPSFGCFSIVALQWRYKTRKHACYLWHCICGIGRGIDVLTHSIISFNNNARNTEANGGSLYFYLNDCNTLTNRLGKTITVDITFFNYKLLQIITLHISNFTWCYSVITLSHKIAETRRTRNEGRNMGWVFQ